MVNGKLIPTFKGGQIHPFIVHSRKSRAGIIFPFTKSLIKLGYMLLKIIYKFQEKNPINITLLTNQKFLN